MPKSGSGKIRKRKSRSKKAILLYTKWRCKRFKGKPKCPKCGKKLKKVPRQGHPCSQLWVLQLYHDEMLYACKNKCIVKRRKQ